LVENSQHFESFPVKFQPSAFKEETKGPILDCNMNLALPKMAGLGTGRDSDEGII
jgi:hypothetical protein